MDSLLEQIPGGAFALPLITLVASIISALVPDDSMPGWLARGLNFLAVNVGNAKNAPNQ
jgi:hypothetical protein